MQKISPYLWFDSQAEEAAALYTSAFADSTSSRCHALRRCRAGAKGHRDDHHLRAGRPALHRLEWRPAVQVHAGDIVLRQL